MRLYSDLVRHPGNASLFDAAEISVLSLGANWPLHLHAQGVRGTGKTTVLRAVRSILPRIRRVRGCPYNCDPAAPHCPQHRALGEEELARLGEEWVPMPFLEISHSAKLGTVVGTVDLQRITDARAPEAALLPGTLARAHRGLVFVDEINRLADTAPELADVLLDVMGTRPGRLQIEEAGLPTVELPISVAVWAASNPDEEPGPLEEVRRQLADRFDLTVMVGRPESVDAVRRILDREYPGVHAHAAGGLGGVLDGRGSPLQGWDGVLPALPGSLRDLLAETYVRFQLESLRSVEAWQWAARLHALRKGRREVEQDDLVAVAPLVLRHRVDPRTLAELLASLQPPERGQVAEAPAGASTLAARDGAGGPPATASAGEGRAAAGEGGDEREPTGGGWSRLFGRMRGWWDAQPAAAGSTLLPGAGGNDPSGGTGGRGGQGTGRTGGGEATAGEGDLPAPPRRARPLLALAADEVVARLTGPVETGRHDAPPNRPAGSPPSGLPQPSEPGWMSRP